ETALSIASAGVEDVEVALGGGDLGITPFANNHVLPPQEQSHEMLTIRVGSKSRMAKTETSDLSTQGIQSASQQARALIEHLPESNQPMSFPAPQAYWPVESYDPEIEATAGLDRMSAVGRAIILAHKQGLSASGSM